MFRSLWHIADRRRHEKKLLGIYRRFQHLTMIPPSTFVNNLELAMRVDQIGGCIVECGVWRGGMSAGMAAVLGPARKYYLFDSFEGLPPAKPIDGPAALAWQADKESPSYHANCSAEAEFAQRAMTTAGATDFKLVRGWFSNTIPGSLANEQIALLRLDGDWYDSTMVCLEGLFDQVVPGGLLVIDDYYAWDGCSRAVHDFLSRRSAIERIREYRDVCYLQKAASPRPLVDAALRMEAVTASVG